MFEPLKDKQPPGKGGGKDHGGYGKGYDQGYDQSQAGEK